MPESLKSALQYIRSLGAVADMEADAARRPSGAGAFRSNTHVHLPPNFSAFRDASEAVGLAAAQGLWCLGASNYYDFGVYAAFAAKCRERGIFPLFGVEVIALIDDLLRRGVKVNDPGNPGKMYLCGKGIWRLEPLTATARRLLETIRANDRTRMAKMIALMNGIFERAGVKVALTEDGIVDMVAQRSSSPREAVTLQERHVSLAFQEAFFEGVPEAERPKTLGAVLGQPFADAAGDAVKVQGALRTHLMKADRPAFVDETFVTFDDALRLILELGGIPCYPTLADGASPICAFEEPVERLIENVRSRNIHCVEFIPARNDGRVLRRYVKAMRAAGLVVTAGTEHNTLDLMPMNPTALGGEPLPADVERVFCEGASVAAAHEFLCLRGECGFVDGRGFPNPAYAGREELIAHMARLGAAVVRRAAESRKTRTVRE